MIKIFVHELCHAFPGQHDRDKDYYTPVNREIKVYSNKESLNFSDVRYWKAIEEIKRAIIGLNNGYDEYIYTGDFDENNNRERPDKVLAQQICDKLNQVTSGTYFEVYNLEPYKMTQCRSWDKNFYYDPLNSECCHDITNIFIDNLGVDDHYKQFLKQRGQCGGDIIKPSHPILCTEPIIREREIESQLLQLQNELKDVQGLLNLSNLRIKSFCRFLLPYIDKTIDSPNSIIDMYPSHSVSSCYFVGTKGSNFYPLNVALELQEKNIIYKLIECGAYKLSEGYFEDLRKQDKYHNQHTLESLFRFCDNEHYNSLKSNLKEHGEWNEELEQKFPDRNES